ncbi:SGNH hydrolase-type esterase domain-containing protein [Mycena capillaripes]|nr:SGNH hydrolase-type esterase domain-containing protein [Mycena capillaripes]
MTEPATFSFRPPHQLGFKLDLITHAMGHYIIPHTHSRTFTTERWVNAWTTMPQLPDERSMPPAPFTGAKEVFVNTTIRQTLTMSLACSQIRLRLSNACGTKDLVISAATLALPANGAPGARDIVPNSVKALTFDGEMSTCIPPGALVVSDLVVFPIAPQKAITFTMYLAEGQDIDGLSCHPGSRTTAWFSLGNHVSAEQLTDESTASLPRWYFLGSVETLAPDASTFVILGDSLCDGGRTPVDADKRWTDFLLARMLRNPATSRISISNLSAAGNCILLNRSGKGPNLLSRLDRDVLSQPGLKYVLVCSGMVDIRRHASDTQVQTALATRLIAAFKQIVLRVHAAGIPVFVATIMPFRMRDVEDTSWSPEREMTRQTVNKWIRTGGVFDAVVDLDGLMRDPDAPEHQLARWAGMDWVHPNVEGYRAMADAFPLELFTKFA